MNQQFGDQVHTLREKSEAISGEVRERAVGYIAAALGLVAGLAWNDAIKSAIEVLFPLQKNTVLAKFLYAVIITAIVVIVTVYLFRIFKKKENEKSKS